MSEKQSSKKVKEKDTEKDKIQEYENGLKRLQAEFENYIKRTEKEKESIAKNSTGAIIKKLLFVVDEFEHGLAQINDKEAMNGLKMIYSNVIKFLEEQGAKPINSLGNKPDPFMHEVIKHEESTAEDGTIIKEIQKGYLFHDLLLRPSKVIIAKNSTKEVPKNSQSEEVIQNE